MVRVEAEIREQQRFATWLRTSTAGLHCDENRVDVRKSYRVVELQHPALLARVILIKDAQANIVLMVGSTAAPCLKGTGILYSGLLIEIISIKDERFVLRIEHSSESLLCIACFGHIVDLGDIEVASTD